MAQNPQHKPSRNGPCGCGSGKKYKHCCGEAATSRESPAAPAQPRSSTPSWMFPAVTLVALVGVMIGATLLTLSRQPDEPAPSSHTPPPAPVSSQPSGETPEPWYYDEENNRHWHEGHGHWHQGPPPDFVQDAEASTPEPWYYDEENNRYWHEGHGHWHQGPPPRPSERD